MESKFEDDRGRPAHQTERKTRAGRERKIRTPSDRKRNPRTVKPDVWLTSEVKTQNSAGELKEHTKHFTQKEFKAKVRKLKRVDKSKFFKGKSDKYFLKLNDPMEMFSTMEQIARVNHEKKSIAMPVGQIDPADKTLIADIVYTALHSDEKYRFEVDRKDGSTAYYNLNIKDHSPQKIIQLYTSFLAKVGFLYSNIEYKANERGSDVEVAHNTGIQYEDLGNLRLTRIDGINNNRINNGQKFDYHNLTNIDLTKYQIYGQPFKGLEGKIQNDQMNTHCLIHSLTHNGYTLDSLSYLKKQIEGQFSKNKIKKLGLNRNIELYEIDEKTGREVCLKWNSPAHDYKTDTTIKIAGYKDHYFTYEQSEFTMFSSKNINACKEFKNSNLISRFMEGVPQYTEAPKISNLRLIHNMFKQGLFVKIPDKLTVEQKRLTCDYDLSGIANEQQEYKFEPKELKEYKVFYADTETDTEGYHEFLLGGVVSSDNDEVDITTNPYDMFDYIVEHTGPTDNIIVYFHNLKFDWSVIGKYFNIRSSCEKGGTLYYVDMVYKKRKIRLKDSYKIISVPLRDFRKEFNLNIGKAEGINYTIYKTNMEPVVNIDLYAEGIKPEDVKHFRQALIDNPVEFKVDVKSNTFDCIEYYKHYLRLDCLVLKQGVLAMNETIEIISNKTINIFNINTSASFAHYFASSKGCYEGIYECKGNLRNYLGKAVFGGRVQTNKKFEKKVINDKIADYDAVSMYPQSMKRLRDELGGLPKGEAIYFKPTNKRYSYNDYKQNKADMLNALPDHDHFVATVIIHKINKIQDNPFVAIRRKASIDYVNECKDETVIIDKITLEDYIEFHHIDFTIIEGVYYNNGFNPTIGDVIEELFNLRLKYKAEKKDCLQQTVKLIMNSIYGRTIQTPSTEKICYLNNKKHHGGKWIDNITPFVYKNFHLINKPYTSNRRWTRITMDDVDLGYNLAIVGISVLSMSKRVINEVQGLASDNDISIYYQDTDSLHMMLNDVPTLETLFRNKYNRELTGKQLGQFHIDFNLNGVSKGVYSKRSIFLGRKCYIDHLFNPENNDEGYHIRMKGVSNPCILHRCNELKITEFELYEKLISEPVEFTLNYDNHHINMVYDRIGVYTREVGDFRRVLSF